MFCLKKDKSVKLRRMFIFISLFLIVLTPYVCAKDELVLNIAVMQEIATCDPAYTKSAAGSIPDMNVYDYLVYPGSEPDEGIVKPGIAKSWDISENADKYTLYLREGIKFHDGSELTAEDVAFSFDRTLTLKGGRHAVIEDFLQPGDTEVIDKYTVVFNLRKGCMSFLPRLAHMGTGAIFNKDLVLQNIKPGPYGEFGDYGRAYLETNDAGSGPFKLGAYKFAEGAELIRFEDYWQGWEETSVDRVNLRIIPEEVTIATALKKGDVDMTDNFLSPTTYEELAKEPGIVVEKDIAADLWILVMNNTRPPFDDIFVRKAVAYAYDYDTVAKTILKGVPAIGPVPIKVIGHTDDVVVYHRDLEKAKEMLAQSRYSPEELAAFRPVYKCIVPAPRQEAIALNDMANLAEIGLNIVVENITWTDLCHECEQEDPAIELVGTWANADIPGPSYFLDWFSILWGTPTPFGIIHYRNPEVSELLETPTADEEEYLARIAKAQKIITEDCPVVFVANSGHFIAHRDYVKGYKYIPAGVWEFRFDKIRIEK